MNILLIDGNPENRKSGLDEYLDRLGHRLTDSDHLVKHIKLREKKGRYCTGCWDCWVKTPGHCVVRDDSHEICSEVIHSDFVLFASPVIMGFTSALLKQFQDKLIPLIHPYIEIVHGECHHRKRYASYPRLGLLLERSTDTDDEDLEIIENVYRRLALNFRSELSFVKTVNHEIEEVTGAIDAL